jgi:hypothetical protein
MINKIFETVKAIFVPTRSIGPDQTTSVIKPFQANVTIEEILTDKLEITDHPVQQGANISDHAIKLPSIVVIRALYTPVSQTLTSTLFNFVTSNKKLSNEEAYALLQLYQNYVIPLDISTGKREYKNMLLKTLTQVNDKETDNILSVNMEFKQVFVTAIQTVNLPVKELQAQPEKTDPLKDSGKKIVQEATEKEKSILRTGANLHKELRR